jgi:membrane protein required for colicin V production
VDLSGLDVVFLILIVFAALRAGFRGFVREFMSMAAVFLGIAVAVLFSGVAAVYVQPWIGAGAWSQVVSFLGLFLLVYLLVKVFERALNRIIERINLESLDRALGFFLGIVEGLLASFILLLVLQLQPLFDTREMIADSILAVYLLPLLPYAERLIGG